MSRRPNRLENEASPYLQQHAKNPVDWYAWGPEALEKAKREDKPILLSIGYSACHWCHVMERESFEDEAIAAQMNEGFVSIKVDREERPDLDQVYQLVVQMMGRSGGWPLTVFLTPEQLPFFGGTYFPPQDRYGMPGFPRVLASVLDAYENRRHEVLAQAQEVAEGMARAMASSSSKKEALGKDLLERASRKLFGRFDERHGGFGSRPKFANTMCLDVLLRRASEEGDEGARARVVKALEAMRNGGIWDQLGHGFHRYSTDERWLVPHFEKMLYDNALLLRLYADAFRAFDIDDFARTASDIGKWMLAEMQSPEGGFYSTLDADTEGEEGKFYVFTNEQLGEALGDDAVAFEVAKLRFGFTEAGNFENTGATVLHEAMPLSDIASKLDRPLDEVKAALSRATKALLEARSKRQRPFRDEKILASWNGLAIAALADASHALCEPELLDASEKAFSHIERKLIDGGRVGRLIRDDVAKGHGFLDDHAFMAWAALELYEATGQVRYLERARAIADELLSQFWDEAEGGFFYTPHHGEELIVRAKDPYDQSIPSGNAIAALVLSKLGAMVDETYQAKAEQQLEKLAGLAMDNPFAFGATIGVLDRLVRGSVDIVLFGSREDPRADELASVALGHYLPNRNIVRVDPGDATSASVPGLLTADKSAQLGAAVAYVCRGRACSAPVVAASDLAAELSSRPAG